MNYRCLLGVALFLVVLCMILYVSNMEYSIPLEQQYYISRCFLEPGVESFILNRAVSPEHSVRVPIIAGVRKYGTYPGVVYGVADPRADVERNRWRVEFPWDPTEGYSSLRSTTSAQSYSDPAIREEYFIIVCGNTPFFAESEREWVAELGKLGVQAVVMELPSRFESSEVRELCGVTALIFACAMLLMAPAIRGRKGVTH